MPNPKPLTTFAQTMVRTHYGRRSLRWISDRLGCSPATVLICAKQLGLWTPITDETRGTASAPAVVCSDATDPFIPPPTREQLMAGSANPRRSTRSRLKSPAAVWASGPAENHRGFDIDSRRDLRLTLARWALSA
jgi:hypothetical protein